MKKIFWTISILIALITLFMIVLPMIVLPKINKEENEQINVQKDGVSEITSTIVDVTWDDIFSIEKLQSNTVDNPEEIKENLKSIGYTEDLIKQGNNLTFSIDENLQKITISMDGEFVNEENVYSISLERKNGEFEYKYYIDNESVNGFSSLTTFKELLTFSQVNASILLYTEIYLGFRIDGEYQDTYVIDNLIERTDNKMDRVAYTILTPSQINETEEFNVANIDDFERFKELTAALSGKDGEQVLGNFDEYLKTYHKDCEKYGPGGWAETKYTGKESYNCQLIYEAQ